ncbi:MAG: glycosyl transferase [Rhodospirillaceae bacterium]|nr:glycosyl transferase [Rhodospirillaceae bacterium]MBT5664795.1 glycosyl transferase [Rhodospirillaceae bacterium]MBT5810474.1 glycosyl transferase [Rhodospirillaceae bacterium]
MARVLFHVQHLLGIGHQSRAAAITRAMTAAGLDVIYATGGFPDSTLDLGGASVVQLPPARARDATFKTVLDETGRPIDDAWETRRREALLAAYHTAKPDAVLVEGYPFARRRFRFELLPLLQATKDDGAPVAVSVRDIVAQKSSPARAQETVDIVQRFCTSVLVHGDAAFISFNATFPAAADIADKIRYTGYVSPPFTPPQKAPTRDGVVVSVGGGAVGGPLIRCALAARPLTRLRDAPWRFMTGPNLPEPDRRALSASDGVSIEQFSSDFRGLLSRAAVSISQAGYNTVMDVLITRTPAVLVPFSQEGEIEQTIRAELLTHQSGFKFVPEPELTAKRLALAVDEVVFDTAPTTSIHTMNMDGAAETAKIMLHLASLKR